jgi:hypothetical protein
MVAARSSSRSDLKVVDFMAWTCQQ